MNIKVIFFILSFTLCNSCNTESHKPEKINNTNTASGTDTLNTSSLKKIAGKFDSLNTLIRDNKINSSAALTQIQKLIPQLKVAYYKQGGKDWQPETWIFPLQGYSSDAIGGNGSGYISQGYNYFDGDKHKAHPAHDIFIHDKNQDCIDDNTGNPVNVLSLTGGIVVALEKNWDTLSSLRGGKYIWIYNPTSNDLFYYAHNKQVFVSIGQMIKPGDTISIVGRTGFNAFKKRSPTHLHITQLNFDKDFYPRSVNLYQTLLKARNK